MSNPELNFSHFVTLDFAARCMKRQTRITHSVKKRKGLFKVAGFVDSLNTHVAEIGK